MRPRRCVHVGTVPAHGFVFRRALLLEAQIARRILSLWTPGVRVHRTELAVVAVLPEPRLVRCDLAPGEPLVRHSGGLFAYPPSRAEERHFADSSAQASASLDDQIHVAHGGERLCLSPAGLEAIDVSEWLAVDEWHCVAGEPLGSPPPPVIESLEPVRAPRATLGIAEAAHERNELLAAWTHAVAGQRRAVVKREFWWTRLLRRISGPPAAEGATPQREGRSAWTGLRRWLIRAIGGTPLGRGLVYRQARYLQVLHELLERGDIDEALRRALPTSLSASASDHPTMGLPGRRETLDLRLTPPTGGSGTIFLNTSWFESLRQSYRRAADRLVSRGQIDEAAFVYLELLDDPAECIRLFEQHRRFRKAAELAEGRGLHPGLVVRLWFLAGERERATLHARRTGAFADAVVRLDATHPTESAALRLIWADTAARGGDYASAVRIAQPLGEAHAQVSAWMDRAIEAGGASGAAMVGTKLGRHPEALEALAATISRLCADPDLHEERLALAEAMTTASRATAVAARPLLRALVRDHTRRADERTRRATKQVARRAGRIARADLPLLEGAASPPPVALDIGAADTGPLHILHAVSLPGDRLLLALGELGVGLLNRRGAWLHRFTAPCDELVVADSGLRALALCKRGETSVIHHLDLEARRQLAWGDLPLRCHATNHDGSIWFAATTTDLYGFDVQSTRARVLWHVRELCVTQVARTERRLAVVVSSGDGGIDHWRFELPGLVLRERVPTTVDGRLADSAPDGRSVDVHLGGEARAEVHSARHGPPVVLPFGAPRLYDSAVSLTTITEDGATVRLFSVDGTGAKAVVRLFGSERVALGELRGRLACADDRGRVVVISLDGSSVYANVRPSLPDRYRPAGEA